MKNNKQNFTEAQLLRSKAEKQLQEKQETMQTPMIETDVKRLLHELQVHQIELEMQNEELREAYQTAEMALKKYTMLYDFAPMGYFTLNSDGIIIELNFTGAEMLGERRFSLEDSKFSLFLTDDTKPVFNDFLKRMFSGNTKESCQVALGHNNNASCYLYIEGLVTGEDRYCLLSAVNISGFKQQL